MLHTRAKTIKMRTSKEAAIIEVAAKGAISSKHVSTNIV